MLKYGPTVTCPPVGGVRSTVVVTMVMLHSPEKSTPVKINNKKHIHRKPFITRFIIALNIDPKITMVMVRDDLYS